VRPEGFDLAETWQKVVEEMDSRRALFRVVAHVHPAAIGWLRGAPGVRVTVGEPTEDGHVEVVVGTDSAEAATWQLAGFGTWLEVIDPPEVRDHLARLGSQLVDQYE
jgi:predicted DNA-binding transcriptional regulator YafY